MSRVNLQELRAAIENHLPLLIAEYLPLAKKVSNGWRIGNIDGEKGESTFISQEGAFHDHAGDSEPGGPFELLASWSGCSDFAETVKWACTKVGYTPTVIPTRKLAVPLPKVADDLGEEARKYLKERGLDVETCKNLPIKGYVDGSGLAFLHLDESGKECHNVKYLDFATKRWTSSEKPSHIPWPLDYVTKQFADFFDFIVITEGHWDAIAYLQCGIPAVSIPNGAKNDAWIEEAYDFLSSFEQIILSYDSDPPGISSAQRVATRLSGEFKPPRLISHPEGCKDANDVLVQFGPEGVKKGLEEAAEHCPKEIIQAVSIIDEAIAEAVNQRIEYDTPFEDFSFNFRPYESTIYTGYTGHGKSNLMEQFICHLLDKHDLLAAVASFEDQPNITLSKMLVHQFGMHGLQKNPTTIAFASKLQLYNTKDGGTKLNDPIKILDLFKSLYKRWGVTHFVIDNLMTLAVGRDDMEGIVEVTEAFRNFVNNYPIHLHIIAHPRKPPGGTKITEPPNPYDVRGPSEIVDMSFNVLAILRNVEKERQIQKMIQMRQPPERILEFDRQTQDAAIMCHKQRRTGKLPYKHLWFVPEYAIFATEYQEER